PGARPLPRGRRRPPRRAPQQPFLPRLEELLTPAVVQIRRQALAATQLRHALLAPQSLQDDADLLLGGEPPACSPMDLAHDLLRTRSLAHRILLPVGPGVCLSSDPYVVHNALTPNPERCVTRTTLGAPGRDPDQIASRRARGRPSA